MAKAMLISKSSSCVITTTNLMEIIFFVRMNLLEFLENQSNTEREALEAYPFKFDCCSYSKGPVKQPVYVCKSCLMDEAHVICYSCSISCHAGHDLLELFDKRNARCDCPTEKLSSMKTLFINPQI